MMSIIQFKLPLILVPYIGMRHNVQYPKFCWIALLALFITCCEDASIQSSYRPFLPELPDHWKEMLGDAHWYVQWVDYKDLWREKHLSPGHSLPELSPLMEWSTPVLAWPYWPDQGLLPGMMRPAGALFPWDIDGDTIIVSWEGGIDAFFWKELSRADRASQGGEKRLPWYFNWKRFRELLQGDLLSETVQGDLWNADWKYIAERTVQSGFDRRRITAQKGAKLVIPNADGYWINSSPFAQPFVVQKGDSLMVNVQSAVDTWVSAERILRASDSGWIILPKRE